MQPRRGACPSTPTETAIGHYLVTRYADIEQVFRDPLTYSAVIAQAPLAPRSRRLSRSCWTAGTRRSLLEHPARWDRLAEDPACLGASLGKLETSLAIEALTRRFPRLRLVEGQQLSFHPNISFRGPQALWVRQDGG